MTFPHLPDSTPFPANDTHVYRQYKNTFDYNMWTPDTRLKLCNVNFRDDYHDVVKFADDDERDSYFKNLDGESVTLTSAMYIARADSDGVKLPVPYATMQKYNYLVIDFTKNIGKLPLQDADVQITYHYFITDIRADSPNTTTVMLERDVWTDYINHVDIRNLMLKRGHAPLVETTPSKLLENPLENATDMLMPDVSYDSENNRVATNMVTNANDGELCLCFAVSASLTQLSAMSRSHGTDITDTYPTYSDNDATVHAFTWGAGGVDTSNCKGASTAYATADNFTSNNLHVYAIDSKTITESYFDTLFKYYPHILGSIKSCFVMPKRCMTFSDNVVINNVAWYSVFGKTDNKLSDITLSKNDFNIPTEYANISKLYVSPYSILEITDNLGATTTLRVEDTGTLSIRESVSLAYPLIRRMIWLNGVGNDTSTEITMRQLNGDSVTREIQNGDIIASMLAWNIPTFALQVANTDVHRMQSYNSEIKQARDNSINTYENNAKSANVNQSNTHASADTNLANSNANADTANANIHRTSASMIANTATRNNCNNSVTNRINTVETDVKDTNNEKIQFECDSHITKMTSDTLSDSALRDASYSADFDSVAASTITGFTHEAMGIAGGAVSALLGDVKGIGTAIGGAVNVGLTSYTSNVMLSNNSRLLNASTANATEKQTHAITFNQAVTTKAKAVATDITNLTNGARTDNTNAQNNRDTETTNRTSGVMNSNADATKATIKENAARSNETTKSNADNSREVQINNGKSILVLAQHNADATYSDLNVMGTTQVGAYDDLSFADSLGKHVFCVKVRTQSLGALSRAGDYFSRFGISSSKVYARPDLNMCKHFTYWESSELTIIGARVLPRFVSVLRDIFERGVTVWRHADEIGRVDIHKNL